MKEHDTAEAGLIDLARFNVPEHEAKAAGSALRAALLRISAAQEGLRYGFNSTI